MSNALYRWYQPLPGAAKAVVIIGPAVILTLIGISIWNKVKKNKQIADSNRVATDSVGTLNQLAGNGVLPTHTDAEFESWSQQLVQAFSGCGTDNTAVENIMKQLNNDADIYKLIAIYGTRSYDGCKWILEGTQTLSLPAAITNEMGSGERDTINSILASKGIHFTF